MAEQAPRGFLVTGTDTGVGKTVVAAALVYAMRARGVAAVGFKPAETGVVPGEESDSEVLAAASALSPRDGAVTLCRPLLRLAEPLAPAVAAERAGVSLDLAEAESRITLLRSLGFTVVVEGAGGLLVPLAWPGTVADLAVRTGLGAIVVARPGLGTLNAVCLTAEALDKRGVPLLAVVLNGRSAQPDLAETTNPDALARLLPAVRCLVLPRLEAASAGHAARALAPLLAPLAEG